MYLVINKCVIVVKVSNFSGQYLRKHWTLDIGVLGYIGIVWPKEHSPEVWHIPPGIPCIGIMRKLNEASGEIFCLLKMWFHITVMPYVERWRWNTLNDTANFSNYAKGIKFRDFNCTTLLLINKTGFTLITNIKQRYKFPSSGHENVHGVKKYSSRHSKPQH